jgi:hypothetical protein
LTAKRKRTPLHARHCLALDSIKGVLHEQGRLYRLAVNGHISPDTMNKMIYATREIRSTIEANASPAICSALVSITPGWSYSNGTACERHDVALITSATLDEVSLVPSAPGNAAAIASRPPASVEFYAKAAIGKCMQILNVIAAFNAGQLRKAAEPSSSHPPAAGRIYGYSKRAMQARPQSEPWRSLPAWIATRSEICRTK